MEKKRIGIIGLGVISKYHLFGLENSNQFSLVSLCDINEKLFEYFDKQYAFYTDYMQMIENEKLDFVIVATHPKTHYEIVKNVMKRNVNVIVEKPAVLNLKEFKSLINLAKSKNLVLDVAYHWQHGNEIKYFLKHFDTNKINSAKICVNDPYSTDGQNINKEKLGLEGTFIDSGVNILSMLKLFLPFEKVEFIDKNVIYCKNSNLPIFSNVKLNIDNVFIEIEIDWRKDINKKISHFFIENQEIIVDHSNQCIIQGGEKIDCYEMERLQCHYLNYFKSFDIKKINLENSLKIHKVLLKTKEKL